MKDNLITLGIKKNDIPKLEKYLSTKNKKIIFPDVFARKFQLDKISTKKILIFLLEQNIISLLYRVKVDSYYWDYRTLADIPKVIDIDDRLIEDVLERTYILFEVVNKNDC